MQQLTWTIHSLIPETLAALCLFCFDQAEDAKALQAADHTGLCQKLPVDDLGLPDTSLQHTTKALQRHTWEEQQQLGVEAAAELQLSQVLHLLSLRMLQNSPCQNTILGVKSCSLDQAVSGSV